MGISNMLRADLQKARLQVQQLQEQSSVCITCSSHAVINYGAEPKSAIGARATLAAASYVPDGVLRNSLRAYRSNALDHSDFALEPSIRTSRQPADFAAPLEAAAAARVSPRKMAGLAGRTVGSGPSAGAGTGAHAAAALGVVGTPAPGLAEPEAGMTVARRNSDRATPTQVLQSALLRKKAEEAALAQEQLAQARKAAAARVRQIQQQQQQVQLPPPPLV
jgi:hypothetical protein